MDHHKRNDSFLGEEHHWILRNHVQSLGPSNQHRRSSSLLLQITWLKASSFTRKRGKYIFHQLSNPNWLLKHRNQSNSITIAMRNYGHGHSHFRNCQPKSTLPLLPQHHQETQESCNLLWTWGKELFQKQVGKKGFQPQNELRSQYFKCFSMFQCLTPTWAAWSLNRTACSIATGCSNSTLQPGTKQGPGHFPSRVFRLVKKNINFSFHSKH